MPLQFTGLGSETVTFAGSDSLAEFSIFQWFSLTALTTNMRWFEKAGLVFMNLNSTPAVNFSIGRASGDALATSTTLPVVGQVGCVLATFDGTDGPRIYWGSLGIPLTEASYSVRNVGAGARTSDAAGLWCWGNRTAPNTSNRGFDGSLAVCRLFDKKLNRDEGLHIQRQSLARMRGDVVLHHMGAGAIPIVNTLPRLVRDAA